jgi:DNA-binding NarL/FixJ family response regulator
MPSAFGFFERLARTPLRRLLLWRAAAVNGRNKSEIPQAESLPQLSIEPDHWREVLDLLGLSPQQAKILDLLLRGVCDKNIAPTVGIGQSTVRAHIASILARTRSNNRTELAMQVRSLAQQMKPNKGEAIFCGRRLF